MTGTATLHLRNSVRRPVLSNGLHLPPEDCTCRQDGGRQTCIRAVREVARGSNPSLSRRQQDLQRPQVGRPLSTERAEPHLYGSRSPSHQWDRRERNQGTSRLGAHHADPCLETMANLCERASLALCCENGLHRPEFRTVNVRSESA